MENTVLQRVHAYLLEKRAALNQWLNADPTRRKSDWLGPATVDAVTSHVRAVEASLARAASGSLGAFRVCGEAVDSDLLEVDYTANVCLDHLSPDQARRLDDELELAKTVQQALLPQQAPSIPGLEVAAFSRPAQYVGGDYFDFIAFSADTYGLALADVAGHGVSAGLQMAGLQALTRALVPTSRSPAAVTTQLHRLFIHNIRFTTFASLFLGAFSPAARRLVYCNAGHNPPFVLRREGHGTSSVTWLRPTGPALGLIEACEYGERAETLAVGDLFALYTDGVVEAINSDHELYGAQRLVAAVERLSSAAPREIVRGIRESVEAFAEDAPLSDDTTCIVCRVV